MSRTRSHGFSGWFLIAILVFASLISIILPNLVSLQVSPDDVTGRGRLAILVVVTSSGASTIIYSTGSHDSQLSESTVLASSLTRESTAFASSTVFASSLTRESTGSTSFSTETGRIISSASSLARSAVTSTAYATGEPLYPSGPEVHNRCTIYWYQPILFGSRCYKDELDLPIYHWGTGKHSIVVLTQYPVWDKTVRMVVESWWNASIQYQRMFGGPSFYDYYDLVFISDETAHFDINFRYGELSPCGGTISACVDIAEDESGMSKATILIPVEALSPFVEVFVPHATIMMHEFGHALGLGHVFQTQYPTDMMGYGTKRCISTLDIYLLLLKWQGLREQPNPGNKYGLAFLPPNIPYECLGPLNPRF